METKFMPPAHAARFGWCYGRLEALDSQHELATPGRYSNAARLPLIGFGTLNNQMMERGMIPREVQIQLSDVLAGLPADNLQTNAEGDSAFALGYYKGLAGTPLEIPFDISAARKRKELTQQALADALGVAQARVAEWEAGKKTPRPATLSKIRDILS